MEKKERRKPEAVQRRNIIGEKMPADSKISADGVLSIDEILRLHPYETAFPVGASLRLNDQDVHPMN
jgi:hypothetical protein